MFLQSVMNSKMQNIESVLNNQTVSHANLQKQIQGLEVCTMKNNHLKNIIGATTRTVKGWDIGLAVSQPTAHDVFSACGKGQFWYGWSGGTNVGHVSTSFNGNGKAKLDFGTNVWKRVFHLST